ncbi:MAG: murein hydrolase activator EnvC family protein [Actinomycetota bacterium]
MTETVRRFPRTTRVAVVAALLGVVSVATTVAGAAPPTKEDVERAKARLEVIEDELSGIRRQLAATQEQLNTATAKVERRQAAVEQVTAELVRTQDELDRARASYERVSTRLNERAAAAYMTGPASSIDFLLDADNVADLTDRIAYVDALAQADAELAVKVANEKNRLVALEAELEDDQAREVRELERAREEKNEVAALFDEQQSLLADQERLLVDAERTVKRTEESYEDWLAEEQASSGDAMGGRVWSGGSLAPFDHVFEVCPVRQPRAYGDGFGAPRYAGGYHLHKGVDIVAPQGTQILAPFDGQAHTSSNALGGSIVYVVGSQGTAYNAHLSKYSASSSGAVSAGEVIGYVGNTGSSTTPHDHFEFHPHTMPGSWYQGFYQYGMIEDAINPYPLLLQACG